MIGRKLIHLLAVASLAATFCGCGNSTPAPAPVPKAPEPVASRASALRLHWIGAKKLASEPSASGWMQFWRLPETVNLQAQTLEKLSRAPGRILLNQTNHDSAALLRPLLEDVVAEESYVEVRPSANIDTAPDEIVLAIRLDAPRATVWETNFSTAMNSLAAATGTSNTLSRWSLNQAGTTHLIEFTRVGDWTIIAAGQGTNSLLSEITSRVRAGKPPGNAPASEGWLQGDLDLSRIAAWLGTGSPEAHPRFSFAVSGDQSFVVVNGELDLTGTTAIELPPWNIPTNVIGAELTSFTAVRGFKRALASAGWWTNSALGEPPDQVYLWASRSISMQTFLAAPLSNSSNTVAALSDLVLRRQGPPMVTNALAGFQKSQTFNGLTWRGFPFFSPFVESVQTNGGGFAYGGFFVGEVEPGPTPPEMVHEILSLTNLVYYDSEMTGPRIAQWVELGQAIRFVSGAAQFPGDSVSFAWLKALATRTGVSGTVMTRIAPNKLSFYRRSNVGLTAVELHLFSDWLESPDFPLGTHSLNAPGMPPPP